MEKRPRAGAGRDGLRGRAVLLRAAGSDSGPGMEGPVILTSLTDLWYGFGVALEPHNLMFCFIGVLVGNMVGVLPGKGPLATISIPLPLTFASKPVAAILVLGAAMTGAQNVAALSSLLPTSPSPPPPTLPSLYTPPL